MSDIRNAATQTMGSSDIMSIVFLCLSPGSIEEAKEDGRTRRRRCITQRALARAARTCRALNSPALDVLWRSVDDIVYLLSVLPSFVSTARNRNDYVSVLRNSLAHTLSEPLPTGQAFQRRITKAEWAHFKEYASRVRELRVQGDTLRMEPSAWSVLAQHCPDGAFVPHCERLLRFQIADPFGFTALAVLLPHSPNLRHLELDIREYSSASTETIQMLNMELTPTVSHLETLSLSLPWDVDDQPERAIPFWEYSHLQSLTITPSLRVTRSIVQSLMEFPNLHTLSIDLTSVELGDQPLEGAFQRLRDLNLTGTPDRVHALMQAVSPPDLGMIAIHFVEVRPPSTGRMMELVQEIYETLAPSLREVRLAFENGFIPAECVLFPNATGLLSPLRNRDLRALTVHFHNHFAHLLDHELQSIVKAWPNLTVFEFTYNRDVLDHLAYERLSLANIATPTISTVAAFAAAHPRLKRLALPHLNARAVSPLCKVELSHPLHAFTVAYLEARIPLCPLALVIDRLFPALDMPECEELEPYSKLQLLLLGMQTIRRSATHALHPQE